MPHFPSEVTVINRQKFLAELAKLLTFMYEEDRQAALAIYEDMFTDCQDEQQLIQFLVSPTRQAVVLARAYNSREHMLSVHTQSRQDGFYEEEDAPAFIAAVESIRQEARKRFGTRAVVDANQLSFFPEEASSAPIPSSEAAAEKSPAPEKAADISLPDDNAAFTQMDEFDLPEAAGIDSASAGDTVPEAAPTLPDSDFRLEEFAPAAHPDRVQPAAVRYERSVPILILYLLPAIPLTLLLLALLLIPTLLSLTLSALSVFLGFSLISCAFGFAIFADILVVLGSGLILMALGLLFLWLFVWFIGGVMAALVNDVIKLGAKISAREVAAV